MFEKKITQKRVHEIADKMRNELADEIHWAITERLKNEDESKTFWLKDYQHNLEVSMINIDAFVHKIDMEIS